MALKDMVCSSMKKSSSGGHFAVGKRLTNSSQEWIACTVPLTFFQCEGERGYRDSGANGIPFHFQIWENDDHIQYFKFQLLVRNIQNHERTYLCLVCLAASNLTMLLQPCTSNEPREPKNSALLPLSFLDHIPILIHQPLRPHYFQRIVQRIQRRLRCPM